MWRISGYSSETFLCFHLKPYGNVSQILVSNSIGNEITKKIVCFLLTLALLQLKIYFTEFEFLIMFWKYFDYSYNFLYSLWKYYISNYVTNRTSLSIYWHWQVSTDTGKSLLVLASFYWYWQVSTGTGKSLLVLVSLYRSYY